MPSRIARHQPARWLVSLVGTKKDLEDLRSGIMADLTDWGYSVRAFDAPDFPYIPGYDPALRTVDIAADTDVLLLIMKQRYGHKLRTGLSVTESEWTEARRRGTPIIACVHTSTLREFEVWQRHGSPLTWDTTFVEDVTVFKFVNKLMTEDFLVEYDHYADLKFRLEAKLRSLTSHFLSKLSDRCWDRVKARKTVSTFEHALSLGDVFDRRLYVSPRFEVKSGQLNGPSIEAGTRDALEARQNLILLGNAGWGKSTCHGKIFGERILDRVHKAQLIPLYVECGRLRAKDLKDETTLVGKLFELNYDRPLWPKYDLQGSGLHLEFFFDALDELTGSAIEIANAIIRSPIWKRRPHMLACRLDFYSRQLQHPAVASRYDVVLELSDWPKEDIISYIEKRFTDSREVRSALSALISRSERVLSLAKNPVGLVMICSLFDETRGRTARASRDITQLANLSDLYDTFLRKWATREISRVGSTGLSSDTLVTLWIEIAWGIFTHRLKWGDKLSSVSALLGPYDKRTENLNSPAVQAIMQSVDSSDEALIGRFVHESIFEYLIACRLFEQLRGDVYNIASALERDTWYEINEFVQQMLLSIDETETVNLISKLEDVYCMALSSSRPGALMIRNKVSYYMGRLSRRGGAVLDRAHGFLQNAWTQEREPFVRQSIGFSRAISGIAGAALEFVREMERIPALDRSNRGYHLLYYGDVDNQVPPFEDPGHVPWTQTRRALITRMSDSDEKRRLCRLIDLYTFVRFIQTRRDKIDDREWEAIRAVEREYMSVTGPEAEHGLALIKELS